MKTTLFAAALLLPLVALAQPAPLLNITDPEGDDVGDGSLVYPRDASLVPGDLDLRALRVLAEEGGLRLEATFRNPIRDPATVKAGGLGSEDLSVFARRGFYAFNIDIYIDTDRVAGSGNTVTLPGRRALIDPAHAWEKVIVLTPRPELMRRQLHDALTEPAPPGRADPAATIEQSVYFATDVRVRGRSVWFFVPKAFLGSLNAADWSLTALVTAAKTTIEAGLTLGKDSGSAVQRLSLGAQQPEAGRPEFTMGYTSNHPPATAVVDLVSPDPRQQSIQLAAGGAITGLNRESRLGAVSAVPPVILQPGVPAATAAPASGGSWFSRALDSVARAFGAGTANTAPAPAVTPAPSLQTLLQPANAASPTAAPAAAGAASPAPTPAPAPVLRVAPVVVVPPAAAPAAPAASAAAPANAQRPRDAAFFEEQELRLRTLKRLRDGGLISEDEYQQKRREILGNL